MDSIRKQTMHNQKKIKLLQIVTTYQSLVTILDSKLSLLSKYPEIDLFVASSMAEPGEVRKPVGKYFCVNMSRTISPVHDFVSIVKLYRYIKKQRFDIIHTHTAKAGVLGAIAGWFAGVPVVHTYHGLPYYDGQWIGSYLLYKTSEIVLSFFRTLLFSQNKQDLDLLQNSRFTRKKITFEGNAVNLAAINENAKFFEKKIENLFSSGKPHLLCVSRLESVKALHKVLDIVMYIKKNNIPVECIIAGKGHLEKSLNQQIRKLGIDDSLRIVYTPYIHSLVAKADVVVLTSKKEGMPRGILEAMALKKPIVATNVLGTGELVIDKKTGLLIPYNEQDTLNRSVLDLIQDKERQREYGNAGYERVLESYADEEAIVRLWVQTYSKIPKRTMMMNGTADQENLKKRVLFVSTVGFTIEAFLIPYAELFLQKGFGIVALANWKYHWNKLPDTIEKVSVPFSRKSTSPFNVIAFFKLLLFLKRERFSYIYTHTPIASVLVRLANALIHGNAQVIYEIHGLHIHPKGRWLNNILFKVVESTLALFTDKIITINHDDYIFARKHFSKANIYYTPGIGVDTNYYQSDPDARIAIRQKYGIEENEPVIITIADFIKRKRIDLCIEVAKKLAEQGCNFKWLIAGTGSLKTQILKMIEVAGLQKQFILTGQLADVRPVISASDIFVLLSMQEGLPRSILEAGIMGIPAVVFDIRGNRDVVRHGENSFLISAGDISATTDAIKTLIENPDLRREFGIKLKSLINDNFSLEKALSSHEKIFFNDNT